MKLGVAMRTMGPQSSTEMIVACARAAEEAGLDDLFVQDHIAIPPDDAEGSGGRYLDPLTTLGFLAGVTERIGLGTGVLILPYRPALPTAKAIATVQELSGGRLILGVGVGWMDAEFRAVGVDRHQRGRITDEVLEFLGSCFANDEVEAHGQRFLFKPRPARPPILVGGAPPHALERTVRFGDGWMPMGGDPEKLRAPIARLRSMAAEAGREPPEVAALTGLNPRDPDAACEVARGLADVGATRAVFGVRYDDLDGFRACIDVIASKVRPALQ